MYRDHLPGVLSLVSDLLGGGAVETLATSFLSVLASSAVGHVAYAAELRGVAKAAGLSVGHVVAMQIRLIRGLRTHLPKRVCISHQHNGVRAQLGEGK
jgi:hypothetical protein